MRFEPQRKGVQPARPNRTDTQHTHISTILSQLLLKQQTVLLKGEGRHAPPHGHDMPPSAKHQSPTHQPHQPHQASTERVHAEGATGTPPSISCLLLLCNPMLRCSKTFTRHSPMPQNVRRFTAGTSDSWALKERARSCRRREEATGDCPQLPEIPFGGHPSSPRTPSQQGWLAALFQRNILQARVLGRHLPASRWCSQSAAVCQCPLPPACRRRSTPAGPCAHAQAQSAWRPDRP